MPSLDQILAQTLPGLSDPLYPMSAMGKTDSIIAADRPEPFKAPPTPDSDILGPRNVVRSPLTGAVVTPDSLQRRFVPVWSWNHDGSKPNTVTDVKSRVLGMGMDYRMAMSVLDEVTLQEVSITLPNGALQPPLPLTNSYVIRKYFLKEGYIKQGSSKMFPLELVLDQSLLVVFGYRLNAGQYQPLTEDEVNSPDFMPAPKTGGNIPCKVGQVQPCVIRDYRIIVCFSLTCCKENNDFEPGSVLGANRIFPQALVMPNLPLKEVQAVIKVVRPAKSNHMSDDMHREIRQILFTDTNLPQWQVVGPGLPLWDNMFDYYETDPMVNIHAPLRVVDSDPSSPRAQKRTKSGVVKKLAKAFAKTRDPRNPTPDPEPIQRAVYQDKDLLKMPRQGDFDNMHMAPRMKAPSYSPLSADAAARWRLDPVAMAPFCVHDCLHTHVRWGMEATMFWRGGIVAPLPATAKGFDNNFNPYCVEGAPQVPHNQSVSWTLLPPAGLAYRGIIHFAIDPGMWQVVFHHGMAYANELWGSFLGGPLGTQIPGMLLSGDFVVAQARTAVELYASYQYEPKFPPLDAADPKSWTFFYWRLRYGGTAWYGDLTAPQERVVSPVPDCMSF